MKPAQKRPAAVERNSTWRQFFLCVAFANLFFLDEWNTLVTRWDDATLSAPPHLTLPKLFAPVLLSILALAMVFWAISAIAPRSWPWICLIGVLIPISLFRIFVFNLERADIEARIGRGGLLALALLAAAALIYWRKSLLQFAALIPLVFSPLLPIQLINGWWQFQHLPPASAYLPQPSAPLLPVKPNSPRVLWLLFDELDQSIVYDHRPASLSLPQFDRLRQESLYFDHVDAIGRFTIQAMPGLLTGRQVIRFRPYGPNDLLLRFADDPTPRTWSSIRNIFDDLRADGFNSALLDGELPYCRALGHSLARCDELLPFEGIEAELARPSILERTWYLLRTRPAFFPFAGSIRALRRFRTPLYDEESRRISRAGDIKAFDEIRAHARQLAADRRYQLVLMHFPLPHLLGFYDRRTGQYSTADSSSYLDNAALADRTFGEVRGALEAAGLWDQTTLLVTSDHPLRDFVTEIAAEWNDPETASLASYPRRYVPFLLKIPGRAPAESHQPFTALRVHDLLRQLVLGDTTHIM